MARESGKFSGSFMEGGWPEVGQNEVVVVGGERAVGEEATRTVMRSKLPVRGATRRRRWQHMEAHPAKVGAKLWWVGWPRGRKSSGGGGWSKKSPESRLAVVTMVDSKKIHEKKKEKKRREAQG